MTTLRHQLLDANRAPIAGRTAAVAFYPGADLPVGVYQRTRAVYATSGADGWLTWQLPSAPAHVTGTPSYVVTGIEPTPVLIAVPRNVSTALVDVVRYGTLPVPHPGDVIDLVTEDELSARLAAVLQNLNPNGAPTTDAQREQYVPARLSDANLRAAIDTEGTAKGWGSGITSVQDATTLAKGAVQLAGDLAGTATAPTVTGGTHHGHTASQVGLANVDNTSDASKPVSTAQQTALNGKVTNGSGVSTLTTISQANYNALATKDGTTLYVIVG